MKKLFFAIMGAMLLIHGCSGKDSKTAGEKAAGGPAEAAPTARYVINVDMAERKRVQEAVDGGWQVWRKDCLEVAQAALVNEGVNVATKDCKVVVEHGDHAIVEATSKEGEAYKVELKRLVKPDGIWTATEIEVPGPGAGRSVHDHGSAEHHSH